MNTRLLLSRLVMATAVLAAVPSFGVAQRRVETRPVTLVEHHKVPAGKKAMVIRRASGTDRDFVALAPEATAADLGVALRVLEGMYEKFGETPARDMAVAIPAAPAMPDNARAKLHGIFVQQLRSARPKSVKGFGNAKTLQIRVPKKEKKSK